MPTVTDNQVRARLDEVCSLIERHEVAVAYLQQERKDLEVALRVLERFDERPSFNDLLSVAPAPTPVRERGTAIFVAAKPADTPTVPVMIEEVLMRHSLFHGSEGLEPKAIAAQIRERWWPDVATASISPIVWRMWKEGRLVKNDGGYSLPEDETPAGDTAGVSEPGSLSGPPQRNPVP